MMIIRVGPARCAGHFAAKPLHSRLDIPSTNKQSRMMQDSPSRSIRTKPIKPAADSLPGATRPGTAPEPIDRQFWKPDALAVARGGLKRKRSVVNAAQP
jgi:hypothetical protein